MQIFLFFFFCFYLAKILRCRAAIFEKEFCDFVASSACRRATSSRCIAGRVTRLAVFHGFTTALFLRGLSPADECAS